MASSEEKNRRIVGAWHPKPGGSRGTTGLHVVWISELGTAHAGDLRKSWRIPAGVIDQPPQIGRKAMTAAPKPVEPKEYRCPHLNGSLLKAPIYEAHFRGKNWLAVVDIDGSCPGGLSRRFMPYGKGEVLYMIEQVGLFDAVEFAADYTTSVGRTRQNRFYGVIVAITETELVVRAYDSSADACIAAQKMRTSTVDKIRALEEAKAAHAEKAAKLEAEIAELKGAS